MKRLSTMHQMHYSLMYLSILIRSGKRWGVGGGGGGGSDRAKAGGI